MLDNPSHAVSGDLVRDPTDGRPARAVHGWSKEKHFYLRSYMDIFATGMKKRWTNRVYVDLLAGPGSCYDLDSKQFYEGSPLLAFSWPFTHHIYVELDEQAAEALDARCEERGADRVIHVLPGDCNRRIDDVIRFLPSRDALVFAFLDPTSTQIHFETVRRLAQGRNVDILLTLMVGPMKRVHTPAPDISRFFGTGAWREAPYLGADGMPSSDGLLACYADQLASIGYLPLPADYRPITIYGANNVPLYLLAFFSKHELGYDFWEKVTRRSLSGQMFLPL